MNQFVRDVGPIPLVIISLVFCLTVTSIINNFTDAWRDRGVARAIGEKALDEQAKKEVKTDESIFDRPSRGDH